MDVLIDFEFLKWHQNEIVAKELSVAVKIVVDSFRFRSPCSMTSHGSDENGLNLDGGHIAYHDLYTGVSEAVAGLALNYCHGVMKCKFLTDLMGRPILTLQDFNCPQPTSFNHTLWCSLPCHKFPNGGLATKTAHSL